MTRGLSTDNVRSASRLKGFALLASGLVALVGLGVAHTVESPIGLEAAYAAQPLTGAPQIEVLLVPGRRWRTGGAQTRSTRRGCISRPSVRA